MKKQRTYDTKHQGKKGKKKLKKKETNKETKKERTKERKKQRNKQTNKQTKKGKRHKEKVTNKFPTNVQRTLVLCVLDTFCLKGEIRWFRCMKQF